MTTDWMQAGIGLLQVGQHQQALDCFERALAERPNDADCWLYKGTALLHLKRFGDARACHDRALQINPLLWTQEGARRLAAGDYQGAIHSFDETLSRLPNDATTLAKKGAALLMLGRRAEAVSCFQQAARLGNPQAIQILADGKLERR